MSDWGVGRDGSGGQESQERGPMEEGKLKSMLSSNIDATSFSLQLCGDETANNEALIE